MTKLVKIIILLTAVSSSVFSAPSQLFFEKVISDGASIVHVEPILDDQNELSGFVYTNGTTNTLIIDKFEPDTVITIDLPATPFKTIIRYSELMDTMYLYTLTIEHEVKVRITETIYSDNSLTQQTTITPTNILFNGFPYFSTEFIEHLDLRFYPNNKKPEKIIYEFNYRVHDYIVTMGSESYNIPISVIYNLDLSEILQRSKHSAVYPAYNFSKETMNYLYRVKDYYTYDFSDYNDPNNSGTFQYQKLTVYDEIDNMKSEVTTGYNSIYSVHVDNFAPSSFTDELIIHANAIDLLDSYNSANHIACYEFSSGYPSEIWYNDDVANIDFSYTYESKDLLVGTDGDNNVIMLNYLNGAITDSAEIKSSLRDMQFYETGDQVSLLNLVGMTGDTVKSYRFDISTDIGEQVSSEELPNTFELFQNHPNPFNGETRLEFSTTENQFLKLSIFNILGQEIKTLVASRFSPGQYSYYWDDSDENGMSQSTGIYFARLESTTNSELIKLIYLK